MRAWAVNRSLVGALVLHAAAGGLVLAFVLACCGADERGADMWVERLGIPLWLAGLAGIVGTARSRRGALVWFPPLAFLALVWVALTVNLWVVTHPSD